MRFLLAMGSRPIRVLLGVGVACAILIAPRGSGAQGTLSALQTDVDRIASAARPSVVTVLAQRNVTRATRGGGVRTRTHTRVGSGVAVDQHLIITTASVVSDAEHLFVRTTNGLQVTAEVAGRDPIFNLALLRVRDVRVPPLQFSLGRAAREGDWVMVIGTSPYRTQITQTVGTIAYRHREPRLALLQLTNTVYPGYSGGAVLNARGQLIGIVHGELGATPGSPGGAGRSFVLPVDTVRPVYESLRKEGRVRHGYLGVTTSAASVESETEPGVSIPLGAIVENVQGGGPAAEAGLAVGDLIVGFDRERVEYPDQLARWVAATAPSTMVEIVWVRDDIHHSASVRLSESPDLEPKWATLPAGPGRGRAADPRISDLERRIQRLSAELERLKNQGEGKPR